MAASDATAIPVKNQAYRVTFPIYDADGDLVPGATGLDSEVSTDAGTFADCTNEATEIATSSGMYYLDLTATEMNADTVAIIVKTSSSGAKTTPIVLYPQEAGDIKVDVTYVNGVQLSGAGVTIPELGIVRRGTAQSTTGTTTTIDASAAFGTNTATGMVLGIYGSDQAYWQFRAVNSSSGDVLTHDALTVTPSGTLSYILYAAAPLSSDAVIGNDVTEIAGSAAAATSLKNILTAQSGETLTAAITGNITGSITGSLSGSVGSVTGSVGSVTAGVTVTTNNDKTGYTLSNAGIDALYTRALVESYAADGAAPTVAQALLAIQQFLQEKVAAGTALTVKKLDGSTTALTFLLNDATTPTSITRTS